MTGEVRHFGATGLGGILAALGRFDRPRRSVEDAPVPLPLVPKAMSRGGPSPPSKRLQALAGKLAARLEGYGCSVASRETPVPHLAIGRTTVIEIDGEAGLFLFSESASDSGVLLAAVDQDRPIDETVRRLLWCSERSPQGAVDNAILALVGRTVAEVERHLILQTLRGCNGNRTHAARVLDISVRALRSELRGYSLDLHREDEGR